ncbi:MAG TPA: DUF6307 family protein [Pseudonocardia sp.]|jgi:hypothetical protein
MSEQKLFRSPYESRLDLVVKIIAKEKKIGEKAASSLAVDILHALDHIPEKIR